MVNLGHLKTMAFDSRKLMTPAAAFTMAVIVIFYTRSSINAARREAEARHKQELVKMRQRQETKKSAQ